MPLDPGDSYYRQERIPPSIAAMEAPLCNAYGVPFGNFGAKGNENHLSGYHRSRDWILNSPDSRYGSSDYSVQLAVDKQGNADNVCAFDFTPGAWGTSDNRNRMKTLTKRLIDAAKAHDPRVAELREVAGTLDGTHVVTYDCTRQAFKDPFDSSHLDHIHGSILRGMSDQSHDGLVAVMLGQTGDDDMFLRGPNGSIYLNAGIGLVPLNGSDWAAVSPQTLVNVPQSVIDRANGIPTVNLSDASAQAIAAAVVAALPPGNPTSQADVVAALQSPAGQAAIVSAVNTAEDS